MDNGATIFQEEGNHKGESLHRGSCQRHVVGDYVVCPGHGVGLVEGADTREAGGGEEQEFYSIRIVANGMKMLVPVNSGEGVRSLVSEKEVDEIFQLLRNHEVELDTSTWNRRYREYLLKIKTGSLLEIADVLRSLFLLKHIKMLSFGEKKMLEQCKAFLVEEISLSQGKPERKVDTEIESSFISS